MTEQEIIIFMKEWKDEVKKITENYDLSIGNLDKIYAEYDKRFWKRNREWLKPIITTILVITTITILSYITNWCSINMLGIAITRSCTQQSVPK